MKVNELSKQLNITNKELISFLKDKGYKISSHMQKVPDKAVDETIEFFSKVEEPVEEEIEIKQPLKQKTVESKPEYNHKRFNADDIIVCKSVVPYKLNAVGVDKNKVYHWEYYGDIDYVEYRDLQALRRTNYITKPLIMIEDPDLCYQWRRELGDTYKYYLGIEYPEEFFDKSDAEFEKILKDAPDTIKDVIKITAINMIRNENYPSVQKLVIIDEILGTCLKEFL